MRSRSAQRATSSIAACPADFAFQPRASHPPVAEHGLSEYAKWYLGIDTEQDEDNKGRYRFPYGDFKDVHRCGVLSAESRAAQYKHDDIESAAAHLHGMLDAARGAVVKLFAMPAVTLGSKGEEISEFHELQRAGAVGFTDDGKPVLETRVMREALVAAAGMGMPVSQHAEDTRLTGGCSMNAGPVAFRLGLRGMTIEAEARIVERDIQLLRDIERVLRRSIPTLPTPVFKIVESAAVPARDLAKLLLDEWRHIAVQNGNAPLSVRPTTAQASRVTLRPGPPPRAGGAVQV